MHLLLFWYGVWRLRSKARFEVAADERLSAPTENQPLLGLRLAGIEKEF